LLKYQHFGSWVQESLCSALVQLLMPVKVVRCMTPRKLGNIGILVQPDAFSMALLGSLDYVTSNCSRLCGDCQHRVPVNEWCACELGLLRDVSTCPTRCHRPDKAGLTGPMPSMAKSEIRC